jgi:hypothetical protein
LQVQAVGGYSNGVLLTITECYTDYWDDGECKPLPWFSSDSAVATVSRGVVVGGAVGNTEVYAEAVVDGDYLVESGRATVTVSER